MEWSLLFFFNSILLGAGLAMDAFSVSLANGLHEPDMSRGRMCGIAGTFAAFQAFMPMAGWICVHTVLQYFQVFEKFIPWIALILLLFIGGKMLLENSKRPFAAQESLTNNHGPQDCLSGKSTSDSGSAAKAHSVSLSTLFIQGIATSIDALSVGFAIADYSPVMALACSLVIAAVTFLICMAGLRIGKKFGTCLSEKAAILGGAILIVIGLEIFITGVF